MRHQAAGGSRVNISHSNAKTVTHKTQFLAEAVGSNVTTGLNP